MQKWIVLGILLLGATGFWVGKRAMAQSPEAFTDEGFREGDIIFQSTSSGQGMAIQLATHSEWNHVGLLVRKNNNWMVLEAVQPVCLTPLQAFIERGDNQSYVVKRLKKGTFAGGSCLAEYQQKNLGKSYDLYFGWGNDRLYCSELVWKIYQRCCGLEVGELQKIRDLDLSHPVVAFKLKERYGKNIPYESKVITPVAIMESELLREVVTMNP
ncbi:MAG: YiiX family permuted papain-like enzyme [Cytophagaceae bacterium]|jgi:hypothetical protein|nr:YiiX family permuted papain-like enzyme [Cytophagaceae bacterium]